MGVIAAAGPAAGDDVRDVIAGLSACTGALSPRLAFLPSSDEQREAAADIVEELAADDIAVAP